MVSGFTVSETGKPEKPGKNRKQKLHLTDVGESSTRSSPRRKSSVDRICHRRWFPRSISVRSVRDINLLAPGTFSGYNYREG